jgi:hypothetical protein
MKATGSFGGDGDGEPAAPINSLRKGQAAALSNPPGPNNRASLGGETIGRHGLEKNVCRVAPFLFLQYIARMLWRNSRGRLNAPAAFIHPCQPIVGKQPPSGPGWAHELKHDG